MVNNIFFKSMWDLRAFGDLDFTGGAVWIHVGVFFVVVFSHFKTNPQHFVFLVVREKVPFCCEGPEKLSGRGNVT